MWQALKRVCVYLRLRAIIELVAREWRQGHQSWKSRSASSPGLPLAIATRADASLRRRGCHQGQALARIILKISPAIARRNAIPGSFARGKKHLDVRLRRGEVTGAASGDAPLRIDHGVGLPPVGSELFAGEIFFAAHQSQLFLTAWREGTIMACRRSSITRKSFCLCDNALHRGGAIPRYHAAGRRIIHCRPRNQPRARTHCVQALLRRENTYRRGSTYERHRAPLFIY